jgi:hypothetical protein
MKLDTSLNHRKRAIGRITSLVSVAEWCGMTSAQLTDAYIEIMGTLHHCPQWVRSYCEGYLDAERVRLRNTKHVYGGYLDGVFYSTNRSRDDYYQKHGIEPLQWAEKGKAGEVQGEGHYWAHNLKPWFVPTPKP